MTNRTGNMGDKVAQLRERWPVPVRTADFIGPDACPDESDVEIHRNDTTLPEFTVLSQLVPAPTENASIRVPSDGRGS